MTPEEIAARCERVEGDGLGASGRDLITAIARGRTVDVEVTHYFGESQRFRITVEEVTGETPEEVRARVAAPYALTLYGLTALALLAMCVGVVMSR